jgi:hypothetical protein
VKSHPGTAWRSHTRPHKLSRVHLVDQQGDLFIHSFIRSRDPSAWREKQEPIPEPRANTVRSLSLSLSGKGKPKRPIQLPCTWRLPISTLGIPRSRVRFAFERWSDPSPLDSSVGRARDCKNCLFAHIRNLRIERRPNPASEPKSDTHRRRTHRHAPSHAPSPIHHIPSPQGMGYPSSGSRWTANHIRTP